jgi:hypothetical protein
LYLFEQETAELALTLSGSEQQILLSVEEIHMSQAACEELSKSISDMKFIIANREQQIEDLQNSASWKLTKPLRALKK